MSNFPEKFIIPEDRIPKKWSQGPYRCCVAASITKVLEVINYVKTGTYKMFSKGYTYGRHGQPDKKQGGMDYTYAMESLTHYGTVPEEMFPLMNEIPEIIKEVANHPDIAKLNKEAEKSKIKGYVKIRGDVHFYENVKKSLYEHQMPLVGNMVGKRHCTVIVGWDGDKLLFVDHDGRDDIMKGKFNEAYYLDGGIDMAKTEDNVTEMPFDDVKKSDWFYEDVKWAYQNGIAHGTGYRKFEPNKILSRAEALALIRRVYDNLKGGN